MRQYREDITDEEISVLDKLDLEQIKPLREYDVDVLEDGTEWVKPRDVWITEPYSDDDQVPTLDVWHYVFFAVLVSGIISPILLALVVFGVV